MKKLLKILIIFIFLGEMIYVYFHLLNREQKGQANLKTDLNAEITPTPIPFPLPTPTNTPVPKPLGFCLNVPVLTYHHIQPLSVAEEKEQKNITVDNEIFDSQMKYLVDHGYQTIKAEDLVYALINHQKLGGKSIVITLDDGSDDAYLYAYPIARKYNLVLNLMIITGLLENPGYLTWGQLKEMVSSGLITAYNHSWSHNYLTKSSREKIVSEISTSKQQIEENLGKKSNIFVYPYGVSNNEVTEVLKQEGYLGAFTTISGTIQCEPYLMTLHRNRIGNAPLSSYGF